MTNLFVSPALVGCVVSVFLLTTVTISTAASRSISSRADEPTHQEGPGGEIVSLLEAQGEETTATADAGGGGTHPQPSVGELEVYWNVTFPFAVVRQVQCSADQRRFYAFVTDSKSTFRIVAVDADNGTHIWETVLFAGEPKFFYDPQLDLILYSAYVRVYALNGTNGDEAWTRNVTYSTGAATLSASTRSSSGAFLVDDLEVSAAGNQQRIYGFDLRTGKITLRVNFTKLNELDSFQIIAPMMITQHRIYAVVGDSSELRVVCFADSDGSHLWSANNVQGDINSDAFLETSQRGPIVFVALESSVYAFHSHGGALLWKCSLGSQWIVNDAAIGYRTSPDEPGGGSAVMSEILYVAQSNQEIIQLVAIDTTTKHDGEHWYHEEVEAVGKENDRKVCNFTWNTTIGRETITSDQERILPLVPGLMAGLARHEAVAVEARDGVVVWKLAIRHIRTLYSARDTKFVPPSAPTAAPDPLPSSALSGSGSGGSTKVDYTYLNVTAGTGTVRYGQGFAGTLVHFQVKYVSP